MDKEICVEVLGAAEYWAATDHQCADGGAGAAPIMLGGGIAGSSGCPKRVADGAEWSGAAPACMSAGVSYPIGGEHPPES